MFLLRFDADVSLDGWLMNLAVLICVMEQTFSAWRFSSSSRSGASSARQLVAPLRFEPRLGRRPALRIVFYLCSAQKQYR
jgi:hypothetical protein